MLRPGLSPAKTKRLANTYHTRGRITDRYGFRLGRYEIENIALQIKRGEAHTRTLRYDDRHGKRMLVAVLYSGVWLPFIWDTRTESVVTCLPEDALETYILVLADVKRQLTAVPAEVPA